MLGQSIDEVAGRDEIAVVDRLDLPKPLTEMGKEEAEDACLRFRRYGASAPSARHQATKLDQRKPADMRYEIGANEILEVRRAGFLQVILGKRAGIDVGRARHRASRSSRISTSLGTSWNGIEARNSANEGKRGFSAAGRRRAISFPLRVTRSSPCFASSFSSFGSASRICRTVT